jgi:hypothetical protein
MVVTAKVVRKTHKTLPKSISGPRRVKIGFPAGKADGGVISRAVWNNFGTSRGIPERPFMQNSVRANQGKYRQALKTSAAKILRGESSLQIVMQKLGVVGQGDIQAEITALMTPPNAPSTIRQKGSSKPLIDTGEMRSAVTFQVED